MAYALSIDTGTAFTAAATWRDGRASVLPLGERADAVPSVLYLRDDGTLLVGEAAERRAVVDPIRVARQFKRRLGDEVPFTLGDQALSAQELTAHLVRWVLQQALEREGGRPVHVLLTYPATWGGHRRGCLLEAAAAAGLAEVELLPEPVAAATSYVSRVGMRVGSSVAVYDLGGGTFDCAVVRKTESGLELCGEPGGDDGIGGADFDADLVAEVLRAAGVSPPALELDDPEVRIAAAQVRSAVVDAKEGLSRDDVVEVPVLLPGARRLVPLTRQTVEDVARDRVLRTLDALDDVVQGAGVTAGDLHGVLLVGGSSRMPIVARLLEAELGVPVLRDVHPKHAVCLGGAVSAGSGLSQTGPSAPRRAAQTVRSPAPPSVSPAPGEPAGVRPEPLSVVVDLQRAGMTRRQGASFALPRVAPARLPVTARDEPLVARLAEAHPDPQPRRFLVGLLAVAALFLVVLVVLNPPR